MQTLSFIQRIMKSNRINILLTFLNISKETNEKKKKIRFDIHHTKNKVLAEEKQEMANAVFQKIESFPEFKTAKTILIYWSMKDELPTRSIITKWCQEKQIVLPSIDKKNLLLKVYDINTKMVQRSLGIWEPDLNETYKGKVDLAIVPGVAFDLQKNRLGRGKGYYDRFFKRNKTYKIGVGFDFQLLNSVPTSWHDKPMDKIVTPSNLIE